MADKEEEKTSKSLPYACEYAKTDRSSCKQCENKIEKNSVRMAIRTPSRFFEGLQDNWYHFDCFWEGHARKGITDAAIRGFDNLNWDDQTEIRERCKALNDKPDDFGLPKSLTCRAEYAKSARGDCHGCGQKISKGAVRLHFRAAFYHPECVKKLGEFHDKAEKMQEYDNLEEEDQKKLDQMFPGWSEEEVQKRKRAHDEEQEALVAKRRRLVDDEERVELLKKQAETMAAVREKITESGIGKEPMETLLLANNAHLFKKSTKQRNIDWLADVITFGGFEGCPDCGGKILYSSTHHCYKCGGDGEDNECEYSDRHPPRTGFVIPDGMDARVLKDLQEYRGKKQLDERVYSKAVDENAVEDFLIPIPGVAELTDKTQQQRMERVEKKKKKGGLFKGGVIIDPQFDKTDNCHVYKDKHGKPWQCLIHQIDEKAGKRNYTKLQLIQHDEDEDILFLCRAYGRLDGSWAANNIRSFNENAQEAKTAFKKAYRDKTKNDWRDRYDYEEMDGIKLIACDGPIIDINGHLNAEKSKENFEEGERVSFV